VSGIDYLLLDQSTIDAASGNYPTLKEALHGATELVKFGPDGPTQIKVLKVNAGKPKVTASMPRRTTGKPHLPATDSRHPTAINSPYRRSTGAMQ
jgi:hypothetical protein